MPTFTATAFSDRAGISLAESILNKPFIGQCFLSEFLAQANSEAAFAASEAKTAFVKNWTRKVEKLLRRLADRQQAREYNARAAAWDRVNSQRAFWRLADRNR